MPSSSSYLSAMVSLIMVILVAKICRGEEIPAHMTNFDLAHQNLPVSFEAWMNLFATDAHCRYCFGKCREGPCAELNAPFDIIPKAQGTVMKIGEHQDIMVLEES